MRILRSFSRADLQMTADTSQTSVAQYLRALEAVGYIDRLPRRGARPLRYRLVRDTGPLAPRVLRQGAALWDDNTHEEVRP